MLEIGRVCIKTAGREAGRPCVILDTIDETYVMITGPKSLTRVRRRKCNIAHLEPLEFQLKLAKNAGDTEVAKLLQAEKILERLSTAPARPERPKMESKPEKIAETEKRGLRERLLGRAKKREPARKEEKLEKPKEKPKEEKRAPEKRPEKPKTKPKKAAKKPKAPAKKPAKAQKKRANPSKKK